MMTKIPETEDEIATAIAGLRLTLEQRVADRAHQERLKVRPNDLAHYDTASLGRLLRPMLEGDGRGWRVLAGEIGVTTPDLSRVVAGQTVSAAKIFAICDWAKIDPRRFYKAPKRKRFTGKALKQPKGAV